MPTKRTTLKYLAATGLASAAGCATLGEAQAKVVVIGGGFGGATLARTLKQAAPTLQVTLIEANPVYNACPFSNLVIGTNRPLTAQQFRYQNIAAAGVEVITDRATDIDASSRTVSLASGDQLNYDRLVLAPGIELDFEAIPGYNRSATEAAPHAWQAGAQTTLLRDQIRAMREGGTVAMVVPDNPYRCPPGPYERASLIAHYLRVHNPRAKLLILDNKDNFSKKTLFMQAWADLFGGLIEWQGLSDGAAVAEIDTTSQTIYTDFDKVSYDVANIIPPQRAGRIAQLAGATDASGWCPIDAASFASTLLPNTYVIGDAAIANAMPKSAFAANAQAKNCAIQILRSLRDLSPLPSTMANTCYSLVNPDYAISVAGVYRPQQNRWQPIEGAGGTSPQDASIDQREREARYAEAWYDTVTQQVFG